MNATCSKRMLVSTLPHKISLCILLKRIPTLILTYFVSKKNLVLLHDEKKFSILSHLMKYMSDGCRWQHLESVSKEGKEFFLFMTRAS